MTDEWKVTATIPVSNELLQDMGHLGERHDYPDAPLWRERWHNRPGRLAFINIFGKTCPPWEHWDKPRLIAFDPFPRLTRITTAIDTARSRISAAIAALKGETRDDDDW